MEQNRERAFEVLFCSTVNCLLGPTNEARQYYVSCFLVFLSRLRPTWALRADIDVLDTCDSRYKSYI